MDELEQMVKYGDRRIRAICTQRGIEWDNLSEQERQKLINEILHEA